MWKNITILNGYELSQIVRNQEMHHTWQTISVPIVIEDCKTTNILSKTTNLMIMKREIIVQRDQW